MTKKTQNLLKRKLTGGFSGLAAVLLLSCSLVFVRCDDGSNGGNGSITPAESVTPVESAEFTSAAGDDMLTITLTDGTFVSSPAIGQFTITTPGTGGFAGLKGGTLKKDSDTQVTITGLTPVTTPGSGQKITVAAEAQAAQAAGVTVTASAKPVPTVKSVTLTGITTPETGVWLTKQISAPGHIVGRTGGSTLSVAWEKWDESNSSFTYIDTYAKPSAEAGTRYKAALSLYCASGYIFADTLTVNTSFIGIDTDYNGDSADGGVKISKENDSASVYVSVCLYFPVTAAE